ncbi:hypothetical protein N0O92_01250 [Alkalihalobacillus sp. MEB130]|uniref:hypothetical protein n=1 Tax=Alkalihalobacillus sp. MEB130 TaxID=2976704 RepID=UPI0028DE2637|nr:hypothetical protein [Alkalihalobacillus sp. MEB130]MDT8858836.1 hypothetical protein [Alkalihalobacillus sp. MEB130]
MSSWIFLMLACILAGFALLQAPLAGTFLAGISPITSVIGILAILVFSLYLIIKGVLFIFRKL